MRKQRMAMGVVLVVGLLIAAVGGVGVVAPHVLQGISRYTVSRAGLYVVAALRTAIGVALVRVAASSRWPRLLRALGALAIVGGVVTLFLGVDRARRVLEWWSGQSPVFIRFWPALALLFGVFIVLAVAPRRRAA